MNNDTIFTTSQQRRNAKAIEAAIAEHGDTMTAMDAERIADELAGKYAWSVRRDAFRAQIIEALTSPLVAEPVAEPSDDTDEGPYPRYRVSVYGHNDCGDLFSSNLLQRDYTTSKGAATAAARRYLNRQTAVAWADDAVITLTIFLPRSREVRCEYDQWGQWITVYDSADPCRFAQVSTATDDEEEAEPVAQPIAAVAEPSDDTSEEMERLRKEVQALKEQLATMRMYQEEVAAYTRRARTVEQMLNRAAWDLNNNGWTDPYTQKDIQQAMRQALDLSSEAGHLYA